MIVNTVDLEGRALAFVLFYIEGGKQHNRNSHWFYFDRGQRNIAKADWAPWEVPAQAFDLLTTYGLCVWLDGDGWHAGKYGENDDLTFFVDAPTAGMAIALATIMSVCGDRVDIDARLLEPEPEKQVARKESKKARHRKARAQA